MAETARLGLRLEEYFRPWNVQGTTAYFTWSLRRMRMPLGP